MRGDVRREDFRAPRGAPEDLDLALGLVGLGRPAPIGPTLAVTPVTAGPYEAAPHLLGLPRPVLLDNSLANSHSGRYSYLTADPFLIVRSRGRRVELVGPAGRTVVGADPFDLLRSLASRYPLPRQAGLPPLVGGAVGYFGYDLGRLPESLPATNPTDGALPELDLDFYDWVLAADHSSGEGWLIATGLPAGTQTAARVRLEEIQARLEAPVEPPKRSLGSEGMDKASGEIPPRFLSNARRGDYLAAVHRAKEYIAAGDVYQVNLSHRLEAKVEHPSDGRGGRAWPLYERLRAVSPVRTGRTSTWVTSPS
jgi:para-aminobenzoate synthetase component I